MKMRAEGGVARLTIATGGKVLCEAILDKERLTIGRGPQNAVIIDDPAISSEHLVIQVFCGDTLLEDLDSTNGTKVNGQPIKRHFLQHGDVIELGYYTAQYIEA